MVGGSRIKIFVGCAANDEDLESQVVLEYTIKEFASQPVDIVWMQLSRDPRSPFYSAPEKNEGWATERWATPFSGFRWAIPALCGFQGKGIYIDSDFLVRADISNLWNQPFLPNRVIIARGDGRFCCAMWDCEAAKQHLPAFETLQRNPNSHSMMQQYFANTHSRLVQPFADGDWNRIDLDLPQGIDAPNIKAIHYTRMERQLQLKHSLPRLKAEGRKHWFDKQTKPHDRPDLQDMFDAYLVKAKDEGHTIEDYRHRPPYGAYRIRGG